MACTEAVEEVIAEHYNDQLRILNEKKFDGFKDLKDQIRKNRDDEISHLDKSAEEGAKNAPGYAALSEGIKMLCRAAICTAKRVWKQYKCACWSIYVGL